MKKITFSFKSLLVAAGLLIGNANAWATATKTLYSQNYQNASVVDWTCTNNPGGLSLITSGSNKYLQYYGNQENSRGMYLYANNSDTYSVASLDNYTVQCDFYIGAYPNNGSNTFQFVFLSNGTTYSSSNVNYGIDTSTPVYLYIQQNAVSAGACTIYVSDATNAAGTLTFATGKWYTIKQVITKNSSDNTKRDIVTTITDDEGNSIIKSADGTSALDNIQTTAVSVETLGYFKGYYIRAGRYQATYGIDNISITTETNEEVVNDPVISAPVYAVENRTITITNGTSSEDNAVTTYYTTDGTDPTASNYTGSFTTASKEVTITSNCTVKAVAISSTAAQSSIVNRDITVGKLTLNTPSITFTKQLVKNGTYYYPVVEISSVNSSILGTPTVDSYTATLNGSAITVTDNKVTLTEAGKLEVYASATNYNNSAKAVFNAYAYEQTVSLDLDNAEATAAMGYTTPAGSGTYYSKNMNYYTLQSNITDWLDGGFATYNLYEGYGIYYGSDTGTGNQDLKFKAAKVSSDQIAHFVLGRFDSSDNWSASYTTHWGYATDNIRQTNYRMFLNLIELYSKANSEALDAIFDCMNYETSSAFATYINSKFDAGELTTAAEVYAAHTAWQIENGTLTDGVRDITKVIRNAAVNDAAATDWAGAGTYNAESYSGAPDIYFIDNNAANMWATQWVYGLPAGSYQVKVATRGSASNYNHVYVSNGTEDIGRTEGNHVGNTGGDLGNGWSWTYVPFTITETTDILLGFYKNDTEWAGCDDWHMYRIESVSATISDAGYATFSSAYALDLTSANTPTGLTAYYVEKGNLTATSAPFTTINQTVAAGQGILLKGTAGSSYDIKVVASGNALENNALVATDGSAIAVGNYVFAYEIANPSTTAGFYYVSEATDPVAAGKAYLDPTTLSVKALYIPFNGTATGVEAVEAAEAEADGVIYNLNGQVVTKDYKGIVIKNGKKYFNK